MEHEAPTLTGKLSGVIAWTGGSMPKPLDECHDLEQRLVNAIVEAECAGFRAFWMREPDAGTRALYLQRARYDAHATIRSGCMPAEVSGNRS